MARQKVLGCPTASQNIQYGFLYVPLFFPPPLFLSYFSTVVPNQFSHFIFYGICVRHLIWAIPHNCLIIVSAHNIDRAEAAAAIPSLAMSWPSLQFGSIRGQHLQAVSYVLS